MGGGGRTTATGMLDSSRDCGCVEEEEEEEEEDDDDDEEKEEDGAGVEVCCAIVNTDRSSSIAMTSDLLVLCVFCRSVRVCEDMVSEFNLDKAARPLPMPAPAPIIVFRLVVPLHDGFDA